MKRTFSKSIEVKRRQAGMAERRFCSRLNVRLPVRFSVAPTFRASDRSQRRAFGSLCRDISISGIQVMVQDKDLFELKRGCRLRLEILLPKQSGRINCLGVLRNIVKRKETQDLRYLCVEFIELPQSQRKRLEQFIRN